MVIYCAREHVCGTVSATAPKLANHIMSAKNAPALLLAKSHVFDYIPCNTSKHGWLASFRKAHKSWRALQISFVKWNEKVHCFRLTKPVFILSSILSYCERQKSYGHILCAQHALAYFRAQSKSKIEAIGSLPFLKVMYALARIQKLFCKAKLKTMEHEVGERFSHTKKVLEVQHINL